MSYGVSVSEVEARWRTLDAAEKQVCETLLIDAESVLDGLRPRLHALVDAEKVSARTVTVVLCAMVVRVLRNPDALTGQSVEDISQNFAGPKYDGALCVRAEELSTLDAALETAGVSSDRASTINTIGRAIARRNTWRIPRRL